MDGLEGVVEDWRKAWDGEQKPLLIVFDLDDGQSLLIDTRAVAVQDAMILPEHDTALLLNGSNILSQRTSEFLDQRVLAELDGRYTALAFSDAESRAWVV